MRKTICLLLLSVSFAYVTAQDKTQQKNKNTGVQPSSTRVIRNPLWMVDRTVIDDALVDNVDIRDSLAIVNHAEKLGIRNIRKIEVINENDKILVLYGSKARKGLVLISTSGH